MDGITYDQFQSALGDPIIGLSKSIEKISELQQSQVNALAKIQQVIGQKVDAIGVYQQDLLKKFDTLIEYQKEKNKEKSSDKNQATSTLPPAETAKTDDKKPDALSNIKLVSASAATIPSSIKVLPVRIVDLAKKPKDKESKSSDGLFGGLLNTVTSLFKKPAGPATSPLHKESVNIIIPPETEVKLQNIIGDTLKPNLNQIHADNQDNYELTDSIYKYLLARDRKEKPKSWFEKLLGPLMLLGASLGKFLAGIPGMLFNIGKQVVALASRLLGPLLPLLAGAGLVVAGLAALFSGLMDTGPFKGLKKILGKGALTAGLKILKNQFAKITTLVTSAAKKMFGEKAFEGFLKTLKSKIGKVFSVIKGIPGKVFGGAVKALKGMVTGLLGKVGGGALAKSGGGILMKMLGTLGKFLKPLLKRIPIIGTIIGLSYAWTRFKSGDIIGGIIDVASAIATLIPGVGTALSIGLDLLNAFVDIKTGGSGLEAGKKKMSFVRDVSEWLYKKIKYVPVIGPLIGMGLAIADGNWSEAFKQLAKTVPVVGTIIDLFENKEAIGESLTSAGDWIGGVTSWIYEKAKTLPVIGSLIKTGQAIADGNWGDVLPLLGQALHESPLGMIADLLSNNKEAIIDSVIAAGDVIGNMEKWVYDKARELPVIGSLLKAGEAIGEGKWEDALGFLGEAIQPLQYIGGLIASGAKTVAITAADNIGDFFSTIKYSLISAVLNMLPETVLGVSVRSRVAKMLGVEGFGNPTDNLAAPATSSNTPANTSTGVATAKAPAKAPIVRAAIAASEPSNSSSPLKATEQANEAEDTSWSRGNIDANNTEDETEDTQEEPDDTGKKMDSVNQSIMSQTAYLKGIAEFQKQTAANTKQLIASFKALEANAGKTINVSSTNSPTNFISSPMTSTTFRAGMLD